MSQSKSVRCNVCKRKVKHGMAFCSFCGIPVIRMSGLDEKTTALFDPGNVDLKPWREPCLIPKRKYVKASDSISHTPWRPIMRQPRMKEIPNELREKRAALLAFHKKTRENNKKKPNELEEGVVLFDGIPFKKGGYEFTSAVDNSEIMKANYAKLASESKNELFYERISALGIYDAIWITHENVAVHISLLERGIKLACNNVVLSYCRWLQISVTFDWHDSSDASIANANDLNSLSNDKAEFDDSLNKNEEIDKEVIFNQAPAAITAQDQYDLSDNCIVFAIPDFAGKHMLEHASAWVDLNAIDPNEHYMSEYLQVLLKPIAHRVKPIGLTIPVVASVDQISFISSTHFTRKISYHSSMFDSASENVLHLVKVNSLDVAVTCENLIDIFHGDEIKPIDYEENKATKASKERKKQRSRSSSPSSRSSSHENSRPGSTHSNRSPTSKSSRYSVSEQLTDFDKEHQIMENAVANRASMNIGRLKDRMKSAKSNSIVEFDDLADKHPPYMNYKKNNGLAFDATIYRGHYRIVVGKTRYMDTVLCQVSCQFIFKKPHIIDVDPLTSLAYAKYKSMTKLEDVVEYVILVVTPSPSSAIARGLKIKVLKLDLDSIFHICPVIKQESLLYGREGSDLKKAIEMLTRMMHYDHTKQHGARLCFHGVNDDVCHRNLKIIKDIWPHEAEILRSNKAVDIQSIYRGFCARRKMEMIKNANLKEMRVRAASLVISRLMAGHLGRQKARRLRAERDLYLLELQLKYSNEEEAKKLNEAKQSALQPEIEFEFEPSKTEMEGVSSDEKSNNMEVIITDTKVILSGEFEQFHGDFHNIEEDPLRWEALHVSVQDMKSELKSKLTLERTNIVYERVLSDLNYDIQTMISEDSACGEQLNELGTNSIVLEKKCLKILSKYLKIFLAREKKIMILKLNYEDI